MCIRGSYYRTTKGQTFRAVRVFKVYRGALYPQYRACSEYESPGPGGWFRTRIGGRHGHYGFHTGPKLSFASFWDRVNRAKGQIPLMFSDFPYQASDVSDVHLYFSCVVGLVEVGGTVHHYRASSCRVGDLGDPGGHLASRMRVLALCAPRDVETAEMTKLAERYSVEVVAQGEDDSSPLRIVTPPDAIVSRASRGRCYLKGEE